MKRILHMTPPEVKNGVHQYIFNHMPFIDQSEYAFSFMTKAAEELRQTKEYERYHFPVYRLRGVQREGREAFAREIQRIFAEGFDVVHLHTSAWRGFLIEEIAMAMGIPKVIVHSHSSGIDFVSEAEREQIGKEHAYYKERFSLAYATDVCACSWRAADWLYGAQIPRDRIQILPNAVDTARFRFDREVRDRGRGRLGLAGRVVVGHVGRYSFTKNQEFLVRSFARAHKRNPRLYLIMIGQGENIRVVRELVHKLGLSESVRCCGWMDSIPDFLQVLDLFCLPSRFEGLPISVVEAQAAGLRCLVSEAVAPETDLTGLVDFLPLDEGLWSEALAEARVSGDRGSVEACFDRAGYSMEASCRKLKRLYGSVGN